MNTSTHPCLLCTSSVAESTTSLSGSALRKLWAALDNEIGDSAYGPIACDTQVHLYRCPDCGFRFYNPEFAGSAEFYEELMTKKTYPEGSREFLDAIDFAKREGIRAVLDIGGGEGAFLDLARDSGLETAGVELNRNASRVAASKGHRMLNKPMENIELGEIGGGAEFLTLFQVVEHVPSPVEFVKDAARLIKPGGFMYIAVPSDWRMLGLLANDPADWPPHHVSKWRVEDLGNLGRLAGLDLVKHSVDPLFGSAIPWAFDLHNRFEVALGRRPSLMPRSLVLGMSLFYRGLKLQKFLPFHGLSLRVLLQKPIG